MTHVQFFKLFLGGRGGNYYVRSSLAGNYKLLSYNFEFL
jgi:hypothetical protein